MFLSTEINLKYQTEFGFEKAYTWIGHLRNTDFENSD